MLVKYKLGLFLTWGARKKARPEEKTTLLQPVAQLSISTINLGFLDTFHKKESIQKIESGTSEEDCDSSFIGVVYMKIGRLPTTLISS